MFKVTKAAGKELKRSMAHHDFDDMPLRIAAQRTQDGSIEYQMGFDEAGPGDAMFASSGIDVVIAKDHQVLLNGTELDFVELEEGGKHFIFKNPNDPNYVEPQSDEAESGSRESDKKSKATITASTPAPRSADASDELASRHSSQKTSDDDR